MANQPVFDGDFAEVCAEILDDLGVLDAIKDQYPESDEDALTEEQINERIDAYGRAFQRLRQQLFMEQTGGQQKSQQRGQKAA